MRTTKAILVVVSVALGGCAQPGVSPLQPREDARVWPKPPDDPRIRRLGELTGSKDLQPSKSGWEVFQELVYGPRKPIQMVSPHSVAVHEDGQRVAVADTNGGCVHLLDLAKRSFTRIEAFGPKPQAFECPVSVAWAGDALWVADSKLGAVAALDTPQKGRLIGSKVLKRPAGITYCPKNELLYITDSAEHAVFAFDREGTFILRFGSRGMGPGQFNFPSQIACGPDETLVVADSLNFRVQQLNLDGSPIGMFGRKGDASGDLAMPKGVACDPSGNIWVVDAQFENVQGFTPDGTLLLAFGQEGKDPGEFWLPAGICIDRQKRIWVADTYNRRVQVFEFVEQ